MRNPLLSKDLFPAFSSVRPEHVEPAISTLLAQCRATLAQVSAPDTPPRWDTLVEPLHIAHRQLARAFSVVSHLNAVVNTPALRDAYQEQLPKVTGYYTEVSQNEALYAKYKALQESAGYSGLSAAQKKLVSNELRDFVLGGAELEGAARQRFAAIQEGLASLAATFDNHVLDSMNAWSVNVDASRIGGIPADALSVAAAKAQALGQTGYTFTLHMPSYQPVMAYAKDRALRETLYRAYVTRASALSDLGKPEWDNAPVMCKQLALREEEAHLLGYRNFAEVSLVTKMAKQPAEVVQFLRDLLARAKPYAERDFAELRAFAAEKLGLPTLEVWDVAYASEQLREQRYAYSDHALKQYFPEHKVLAGLYRVIGKLYGVKIVESKADTWHADVRFFEVQNGQGVALGHFYLDLYARDHKQGGAWADSAGNRARFAVGDGLAQHTPLVFLTCNLSAPTEGKPACFTHDDVITIFHEFGHGLHVLLSRVDQQGLSGWDGVEWDAVELPSQFMENYCYEWDVLQHMTAHVDTGETLPRVFFDKVIAAKNFQAGMGTVRQIEFALFDMLLHSSFDPKGEVVPQRMQDLIDAVRREVAVLPYPSFNRMQMSFSHIFAGGYAAGYYSYKWAEVLSADAYAAFEEEGVLSPETGERFWSEVIGRGGTRSAMDNFIAFRGRAPSMDAMLRHYGMAQ
jgi:oligopeptidase A